MLTPMITSNAQSTLANLFNGASVVLFTFLQSVRFSISTGFYLITGLESLAKHIFFQCCFLTNSL